VSLLHSRHLARTRLLAASALEGDERQRALGHLAGCPLCRAEHDGVVRLLEAIEQDPIRRAPLPIPLHALQTRVRARIGERQPRSSGFAPALAAAAAVALAILAAPWTTAPPPAPAQRADEGSLDRLERTLAREETARFLTSAQEVLITVSNPNRCPLKKGHVDVGEESRRSEVLLRRRTLLAGSDAVPNAAPVLNDVERVLREVAALDPCAGKDALEEIHREMAERRLMLRIDLMTRELAG
jgi:hypothetical protein